MLTTIDSMSPSMTAPSSGIKIHTKKWYQQMALILLCEEVIEPTASAVTCVKNDICDIILQLYCERKYATKGLHMPKGHMRPIYWRNRKEIKNMGTRLTLILEQLCWSLLIWMCMFPAGSPSSIGASLRPFVLNMSLVYIYTWYNSFCCIIIIR